MKHPVFSFDDYAFKLMDYFGGDIASQSEEQLLNAMIRLDKDFLSEKEMKLIIQTAQQMDANP